MQNAYIPSVLTDLHSVFTLSQRKETKRRQAVRENAMSTVRRPVEAPSNVSAAEGTLQLSCTLSPFYQPELPNLVYIALGGPKVLLLQK